MAILNKSDYSKNKNKGLNFSEIGEDVFTL